MLPCIMILDMYSEHNPVITPITNVAKIIKPSSEDTFFKALFSPSSDLIKINFARNVSLMGPQRAFPTVVITVVTKIQVSLSIETPKYLAENVNVTIEIKILIILNIKSKIVILDMLFSAIK